MLHSTRQIAETTFHSAGQVAENASGNQVHARRAIKGGIYACMGCKQKVVLRVGKKILKNGQTMITHFAHSVTNIIKCSGYQGGETVQHLDAKWCLADNIEDFRFIMQSCDTCEVPNPQYCIRFSKQGWTVVVEGQVAGTGTGDHHRRADVLVQMNSSTVSVRLKPWYSLEVKHSHAVSVEKTKELHSVNCGIIEVLAEDVLHFKDILQADKPCYLRNVHNMGCIPWTCKTCMERVATERTARWLEYEEWYTDQWRNYDKITARSSKRKLYAQRFESMPSPKKTKFEVTDRKLKIHCVGCNDWPKHYNYHTFWIGWEYITGQEPWWHDAVLKDAFLSKAKFKVNRLHYCNNCLGTCLNCASLLPRAALKNDGLCMRCNTDDCWFDTGGKRRWCDCARCLSVQ
jgi:hypothetical protein